MTFKEIKEQAMFQTNNDASDLGDFAPHIDDYINEGYGELVFAYTGKRVGDDEYPALAINTDVPNLPSWTHRALADYATWMIYRNGNPLKQQRGFAFNSAFMDVYSRVRSKQGQSIKFTNLY